MKPFITKGSRIRAEWAKAKTDPPASVAGMMLKFEVSRYAVVGVVRHVRGDDPVNPKVVRVYVDPDPGTWDGPTVVPDGGCSCGHPHVEVNPDHVTGMEST
jgi:hypothetical protein